MTIYYNLFLRNWLNHRASIEQIDQAAAKGLISVEEGQQIKGSPRD